MVELRTARLLIRDWQPADEQPWAELNADPAVRQFLGPTLTPEQSLASIRRFQTSIAQHGFGFWALEVTATAEFIGFVGLDVVDPGVPFAGVEIGWRLARSAWGHGYASEAALAVLRFARGELGLSEVVAVTAETNLRSQAVMRRLGLVEEPAYGFDDPTAPVLRQVVYRTTWPDQADRE